MKKSDHSQPTPQNENIKMNEDGTISPIDPSKPTYFSTQPTPEDEEFKEKLIDAIDNRRMDKDFPVSLSYSRIEWIIDQLLPLIKSHADQDKVAAVLTARIQGHQTTSTVLQYVIDADSGFMGDSKAAAKHWKKKTDELVAKLQDGGGTV